MQVDFAMLLSTALLPGALFAHGVTGATDSDLCQQERGIRAAAGVTSEGPACAEMTKPGSLLAIVLRSDDESLFLCRVILCMAAPDGPDSIMACEPTISDYKRRLQLRKPIPACELFAAGEVGQGSRVATVDFRGEVASEPQATRSAGTAEVGREASDRSASDGVEQISSSARLAYSTYGVACNDVDSMITQMGRSRVSPIDESGDSWKAGGRTVSSFMDWANQPAWWRSGYQHLAGHRAWDDFIPWFVVFEQADNAAGPAMVEIGAMSFHYLSRSRQTWVLMDANAEFGGSRCARGSSYHACGPLRTTTGPEGQRVFINGAQQMNVHGWWNKLRLRDPGDVQAISVTAQARLVGSNAESARHALMLGGDFYPSWMDFKDVNPGAGNSRLEPLGAAWKTVSFTTLTDQVHTYDGGRGISSAELRRNPPPCSKGS